MSEKQIQIKILKASIKKCNKTLSYKWIDKATRKLLKLRKARLTKELQELQRIKAGVDV